MLSDRFLSFFLFCLVFIHQVLSSNEGNTKYSVNYKDYDHHVLSEGRLVIENLFTQRQLDLLMEVVETDKILNVDTDMVKKSREIIMQTADYIFDREGPDYDIRKYIESISRNKSPEEMKESHRKMLLKTNVLVVQDMITSVVEAFFNHEMRIKRGTFYVRSQVTIRSNAEKTPPKLNKSEAEAGWQLVPHADNCLALLSYDSISCYYMHDPEYLDRDVSIILFLNDLAEGGELTFLDFPNIPTFFNGSIPDQNHVVWDTLQDTDPVATTRTPSSAPVSVTDDDHIVVPPKQEEAESNERRLHSEPLKMTNLRSESAVFKKRSLNSSQKAQPRYLPVSQIPTPTKTHVRRHLQDGTIQFGELPDATQFTLLKPKTGRLVVFSSGIENVHAVTQVLNNDRRNTFFMFFSKILTTAGKENEVVRDPLS